MQKKIFLLFIILLFILPTRVFGAQLFFGVKSPMVSLGDKFEIGVFLDSKGEVINAGEGQITFPADALELDGFYTGSSILPFWVQSPALVLPGVVSFSGVVPGGFNGSKGYLFSLIFKTLKPGPAAIASNNEQILLNDGKGTLTSITRAPLTIMVTDKAATPSFKPLYDATPPELSKPQVAQDPAIFNGNYFLTFAAQDKGSGIDHYEIMEKPPWYSIDWFFAKPQWVKAQSPQLLQDQELRSIILVKAVDVAGNQIISTNAPLHNVSWYKNYLIWIIIIVIVLAWAGFRIFYVRKKR